MSPITGIYISFICHPGAAGVLTKPLYNYSVWAYVIYRKGEGADLEQDQLNFLFPIAIAKLC